MAELEQRVLGFIVLEEVTLFLQGTVQIRSTRPPGDCVETAYY
jgi:hypothetical protein